MTGSFVSPLADAARSPQLYAPAGFIASILDGYNVWKLLGTLFIAAVIYDQCKSTTPFSLPPNIPLASRMLIGATYSQVPLSQGLNYWSRVQDSLYGPVPPIRQPQIS